MIEQSDDLIAELNRVQDILLPHFGLEHRLVFQLVKEDEEERTSLDAAFAGLGMEHEVGIDEVERYCDKFIGFEVYYAGTYVETVVLEAPVTDASIGVALSHPLHMAINPLFYEEKATLRRKRYNGNFLEALKDPLINASLSVIYIINKLSRNIFPTEQENVHKIPKDEITKAFYQQKRAHDALYNPIADTLLAAKGSLALREFARLSATEARNYVLQHTGYDLYTLDGKKQVQ